MSFRTLVAASFTTEVVSCCTIFTNSAKSLVVALNAETDCGNDEWIAIGILHLRSNATGVTCITVTLSIHTQLRKLKQVYVSS